MKTAIFLLCLMLLAGCSFHSEPDHAAPLQKDLRLQNLQGVYSNRGDPDGYLSNILWGVQPQQYVNGTTYLIDKIEVIPAGNRVVVRAVAGECYLFQKHYEEGKDFTIKGGQIVIHDESALLNSGTGDPLVGPRSAVTTIGLDTVGHGISREEFLFAGAVFLVVPAVMHGTEDRRYERLNRTPVDFIPCKDQLNVK